MRRYQEQQRRAEEDRAIQAQDRTRALSEHAEDRTRAASERDAAQQYNAMQFGAGVGSQSGPTDRPDATSQTFEQQQKQRGTIMADLVRRMPAEAGRMAAKDFHAEEEARTLAEMNSRADASGVQMRESVIHAINTGAIDEENGAKLLADLDFSQYIDKAGKPDIQAKMKALSETDPTLASARKSIAKQNAIATRWQTMSTGLMEEFTKQQPLLEAGGIDPDLWDEALGDLAQLEQDFPTMTGGEARAERERIRAKITPDFKKREDQNELMRKEEERRDGNWAKAVAAATDDGDFDRAKAETIFQALQNPPEPPRNIQFSQRPGMGNAYQAMPSRQSILAPGQPQAVPQTRPVEPAAAPEQAAPQVPGQIEPGNLELFNRPVLKNADGSVSTTSSMSFEMDGVEILVPTVIDGKRLSEKEAIEHYKKTGEHLGKFRDAESADAYANKLHEEQARRMPRPRAEYVGKGSGRAANEAIMRTRIAELAVRGVPGDEAARALGLDLESLNDEDWKAIQTLIEGMRKAFGEDE